jgi:hypothetical protein
MERIVRRTGLMALIAVSVFAASSVSCGSASEPEEPGSGSLAIHSAEWRVEPEPRAVVSGEWGLGISTPPRCSLLEGENGDPSDWYDPTATVELDGGRFYTEFVRDPEAESRVALDPDTEYYVRCRTSGDTGSAAEAIAPVKGEVPETRRAAG